MASLEPETPCRKHAKAEIIGNNVVDKSNGVLANER
jgi:hypothetical protein